MISSLLCVSVSSFLRCLCALSWLQVHLCIAFSVAVCVCVCVFLVLATQTGKATPATEKNKINNCRKIESQCTEVTGWQWNNRPGESNQEQSIELAKWANTHTTSEKRKANTQNTRKRKEHTHEHANTRAEDITTTTDQPRLQPRRWEQLPENPKEPLSAHPHPQAQLCPEPHKHRLSWQLCSPTKGRCSTRHSRKPFWRGLASNPPWTKTRKWCKPMELTPRN